MGRVALRANRPPSPRRVPLVLQRAPPPPSARTPRTFVGARRWDRRKRQTETLVSFQRPKAVDAVAPGQVQDHQSRQNLGVRPLLGASPCLHVSSDRLASAGATACRWSAPARVARMTTVNRYQVQVQRKTRQHRQPAKATLNFVQERKCALRHDPYTSLMKRLLARRVTTLQDERNAEELPFLQHPRKAPRHPVPPPRTRKRPWGLLSGATSCPTAVYPHTSAGSGPWGSGALWRTSGTRRGDGGLFARSATRPTV